MTLFEKLRELRKENKFSLRYVAKELGVSHVTVSDYEKGNRTPTNRRLAQLSELYGCDLSEFKRPEPIVWHPYPDEKPQRDDLYLVTTDGRTRTETGFWFGDEGYWSNAEAVQIGCDDWLAYDIVIAWAEFPEPYKEADR